MGEGWKFKKGCKPPHILYICVEWPNRYKPTWDWQIAQLIRAGYEVTVLQSSVIGSREVAVPNSSLTVRYTFYPATLRKVFSIFRSPVALGTLILNLLPRKLMLLHSKGRSLRLALLEYIRACCLPRVEPDVILVKNLSSAAHFTFLSQIYPNSKLAMYYHGGAVPGVHAAYLSNAASIFRTFTLVFTNTKYSKSELEGLGCPSNNINVLPVGLDMGFFPDISKVYRHAGVTNFLSASRISEEKGIIYAIKAVEEAIKDGGHIFYHIVGDGDELPRLKEYVSSNGLSEHIKFYGYLENEVLRETLYPIVDFVINTCFPTEHWAETQCVSIQEANLFRIPAVASKCGGLPEVVQDGCTGFLCEIKSVDSAYEVISYCVNMPYEELEEMGLAARQYAESKFDVELMTRNLLAVINDVG